MALTPLLTEPAEEPVDLRAEVVSALRLDRVAAGSRRPVPPADAEIIAECRRLRDEADTLLAAKDGTATDALIRRLLEKQRALGDEIAGLRRNADQIAEVLMVQALTLRTLNPRSR